MNPDNLRTGGKAPFPAKDGAHRSVLSMKRGPNAAVAAPTAQSPGLAYLKALRQCLFATSQPSSFLRPIFKVVVRTDLNL